MLWPPSPTVGQSYTGGNLAHGRIKLRTTGEALGLFNVLQTQGRVLI